MSTTPSVRFVALNPAGSQMPLLMQIAEELNIQFSFANQVEDLSSQLDHGQSLCLFICDTGDGTTAISILESCKCTPPLTSFVLVSKIAPELALKVGRAGGRGIFCADTPLSVALTLIREGLTEEASLAPARKRRAELLMSIKSLVPAEHEVFRWVLSGVANKMIAKRLRVSQRTIEARRQKVFRKLSVASLAELVRLTALYADIEDLRIDVEPEEPTSMHAPI